MRTLLLITTLLVPACAASQTFSNADSIEVHGLVFIGATDHASYGYGDTVRVQYRVANRGADVESLWVTQHCTGALTQETWCDTLGVCEEEPEMRRVCAIVDPPAASLELFPPGERVLEDFFVPTRFILGSTMRFLVAKAHFFDPWDTTPYFHFAIPYVRRPVATTARARTWGSVKALYRD